MKTMTASEMFDFHFARLMHMGKKGIVAESVQRGFTAEQAAAYMVKNWNKTLLARKLADEITRLEIRGY